MKTNFKFLSVLAVALLAGFSSCSNDEETNNNGEEKSLFFKMEQEAVTKAGAAVADATPVTFAGGYLYFVNGSGAIVDRYQLSTSVPTDLDGKVINMTQATAGVKIENLPGSTAAAHVFGNTPTTNSTGSALTLPASGSINTVIAMTIGVTTQSNTASVNLYGTGNVVPDVTDYKCDVSVAPTVARIEISDITGSGDIKSFTVAGIFVDRFNATASLDGVTQTNQSSGGTDRTQFVGGSALYPNTSNTITFDSINGGYASAALVAKPASGIWGYNLFAKQTAPGTSLPGIIIRLKNIVTNSGDTYSDPQFITIKGFYQTAAGDITGLLGGNVYKIDAGVLKFDETHLHPDPNMETIDVNVKVTVVNWKAVSVKPEL